MSSHTNKTVLILGANSDVAKACIPLYLKKGFAVVAVSRSTSPIIEYLHQHQIPTEHVTVTYFDAVDFNSHAEFYKSLSIKPSIVIYAAGFLVNNDEALLDWKGSYQMMNVHYAGAVSILNIVATDQSNTKLEKIIGLSSLSGVRGRKSNFIYGSSKAAFTQYLAGLRQYLFHRKIVVNVIVAGYIRSKMTDGLNLPESLMLEPEYIATAVVNAGNSFIIVPGLKWKLIYHVLRLLPEQLVAKLP